MAPRVRAPTWVRESAVEFRVVMKLRESVETVPDARWRRHRSASERPTGFDRSRFVVIPRDECPGILARARIPRHLAGPGTSRARPLPNHQAGDMMSEQSDSASMTREHALSLAARVLIEERLRCLQKFVDRKIDLDDIVLRPTAPDSRRHLFEEACELYWNELNWEQLTDEELYAEGELTEMVFPGSPHPDRCAPPPSRQRRTGSRSRVPRRRARLSPLGREPTRRAPHFAARGRRRPPAPAAGDEDHRRARGSRRVPPVLPHGDRDRAPATLNGRTGRLRIQKPQEEIK